MANEFKLNFTAEDINRRLTDIDNKQDNLTSGDLIEIKDGIIRSTLGDDTGETIEIIDEVFSWKNMYWTKQDEYLWASQDIWNIKTSLKNYPEEGTIFDIYLTLPDTLNQIHYSSQILYIDEETPILFCNLDADKLINGDWDPSTEPMPKVDSSLPGLYIVFYLEENENMIAEIVSDTNYTGSSISIQQTKILPKYIKLPENSLEVGDLLKIEDGKISLTLGDFISKSEKKDTTTRTFSLVNASGTEQGELDDGTKIYVWVFENQYMPEFLNRNYYQVRMYDENGNEYSEEESSFLKEENDFVILFNGDLRYLTEGIVDNWIYAPLKDSTKPLCLIQLAESGSILYIQSLTDLSAYSIELTAFNQTNIYKTIPTTALPFDEWITDKNSNKLLSSGTIASIFESLETSIGDSINDLYEITDNLDEKIENVGKSGTGTGSEIFNEYTSNTASGNYSHAQGYKTIASGECQHVEGKYNIEDTENKYVHIVGNGKETTSSKSTTINRSNAHTIDWNGNAWFAGEEIYLGGTGQNSYTTKAETTAYKIQTLSDDNVSLGDLYYPSSLAVMNYVNSKIGDIDTVITEINTLVGGASS